MKYVGENITGAHYLPRLCTNVVINDVFNDQIIVPVVFDGILLSRDESEKKAPASTVADNNLTLIKLKKPMGLVVLSGHAFLESKHFCEIRVLR